MTPRGSGANSAKAIVKEDAMSAPPNRIPADDTDTVPHDPDADSTWNTIPGTVDLDEIVDEEDLEEFLVEPTTGPPLNRPDSDAGETLGSYGGDGVLGCWAISYQLSAIGYRLSAISHSYRLTA
jgi:hypothetical protein